MSCTARLHSALLLLACTLIAGCQSGAPAPSANPIPSVQQFRLTLMVQGNGTVEINPVGDLFDAGAVVSVQARPGAGWVFTRWSGDLTTTNTQDFIHMDADRAVTAVFDPAPPDLVLLDGASIGSGTIYVDPPGQSNGLGGLLYPIGTTVTLSAVAEPGWHFSQ